RKVFMPLFIVFMLIIAACGSNNTTNNPSSNTSISNATTSNSNNNSANNSEQEAASTEPQMVTYQSENGPIEVPANPQSVVMLSFAFVGNVLALGVHVVGVDSWAVGRSLFINELTDVAIISEDDVEGVLNLERDLIIPSSTPAN